MWKFTRTITLVSLWGILLVRPVIAQEGPWRSFTSADGLPSNFVQTAGQSFDGVLWLGTDNGLAKFFHSSSRESFWIEPDFPAANVNVILGTPDGHLWVGTDSGLYRRMPEGSWSSQPEPTSQASGDGNVYAIYALLLAEDGRLWAGGEAGLAYWDGRRWQPIFIQGTSPYVKALAQDRQERIWVADTTPQGPQVHILQNDRILRSFTAQHNLPPGADLKTLAVSSDGDVWLGTDGGLVQFSDLSVANLLTIQEGLSGNIIWSLHENPRGGMWVGTSFGLDLLVNGKVRATMTTREGLAGDAIISLFYDGEGSLWIGTQAGATRIPLGAWFVEPDTLLQYQPIQAILPGSRGEAYLAVPAGVVHLTESGAWELITTELPGQLVYTLLHDPEGRIWAGTNYGLAQLENDRLVRDPRLSSELSVASLLYDTQDTLWVGTTTGLYSLPGDPGQSSLLEHVALVGKSVQALWETRSGDVWAGTLNQGASRFRAGAWENFNKTNTGNGLVDDFVLSGLEDQAGNLWFGTLHGLSKLRSGRDPHDSEAWSSYGFQDLSGEQINTLWEDIRRAGLIWVGTDGGLNLIEGENPFPSAFTTQDGLSHKWINILRQAQDGMLWIGTLSGLTYHYDAGIPPQLIAPSFIINNRLCDESCQTRGVRYDAGAVVIEYQASDLVDLVGLGYHIEISSEDGLPTYITDTKTTSITYPLVEPGLFDKAYTYQVLVQAYDRDFNRSSFSSPQTLKVNPPTLSQWLGDNPIYLVLLIIFTGIGFYRVQRLLQRWRLFQYPISLDIAVGIARQPGLLHVKWQSSQKAFLWRKSKHQDAYVTQFDWEQVSGLAMQVRDHPATPPGVLQELGALLYAALFSEQVQTTLDRLGLGRKLVRLRLKLPEDRVLRELPWEFTHTSPNEHKAEDRKTIDTRLMLVRDLSEEQYQVPLPGVRDLNVLVVWANQNYPGFGQLTRLEYEYERIVEAAAKPGKSRQLPDMRDKNPYPFQTGGTVPFYSPKNRIRIQPLPDATWENFKDRIQQGFRNENERTSQGYEVVHFSGHGGIHRGNNVLFFLGEDGQPHPIEQGRLVELFRNNQARESGRVTRMVVLNACLTAQASEAQGVLGLAEALVKQGDVLSAIGMGYPISEESAIDFIATFYQYFFADGLTDYAVMQGRISLANRLGSQYRDWGVPRLYIRQRQDQFFKRL
jgi:ligand-binding sensor domain-containing protein